MPFETELYLHLGAGHASLVEDRRERIGHEIHRWTLTLIVGANGGVALKL
jgi:hypothetical protein